MAWQLEYTSDKSYETAVRISCMGLFFFLLEVNENQEIRSVVLMLASKEIASTFNYKIKICGTKDCRKLSSKNVVCNLKYTRIKIGITFIFRFHRRPIQIVVFLPFVVLTSSSAGLVQCRSFFCRQAWAVGRWS